MRAAVAAALAAIALGSTTALGQDDGGGAQTGRGVEQLRQDLKPLFEKLVKQCPKPTSGAPRCDQLEQNILRYPGGTDKGDENTSSVLLKVQAQMRQYENAIANAGERFGSPSGDGGD